MRINKFLADAGICSRRKADELIKAGKVFVNDVALTQPGYDVQDSDEVVYEGQVVRPLMNKVYYLLNKPIGCVTSVSDDKGRMTVIDLFADNDERLFPVGRLDYNTAGALFVTNDGDFANGIMHPSRQVTKTYRVTVRPPISEEQLAQMSAGVTLEDGFQTAPANIVTQTVEPERVVLLVTIHEGKKREVRRMCDAVGLEVARLRRISIGPVKLGMLRPGQWRDLTTEELRALRERRSRRNQPAEETGA